MLFDFFAPRLDYLLFIHALGLFFMAAFCAHFFVCGRRLTWCWLALFAVSLSLALGLRVVAQAMPDPGGLVDMAEAVQALSGFFLILFALHGLVGSRLRGLGYLLAAGLGVLPVAGAVFLESRGFHLAVTLGFAPCAGLLALVSLRRNAGQWREELSLVPASAPLLGLYLAVVELGPLAHALARAALHRAELGAALPTVPHAVAGAVTCVAVVAALARSSAFCMDLAAGKRPGRLAYTFGLTAVVVAVFVGFAITDLLGRRASDSIKDELFMRVSAVGNALAPEEVAQLPVAGGAEDSEPYKRLLMQLTKIRLSNPDLRFVYMVGLGPGRKAVITLDTEPPTSVDYAVAGEPYEEAPPELLAIFSSGKTDLVGPYTDRWGSWISGFAPVRDEYGAILGVVGMDIRARNLQASVAMSRFLGIIMAFLLSVIGVGAGIILQRNRELAMVNSRLASEMRVRADAEQGLADSERKYRHLVEMANDGIAIFQRDMVRYANPVLARLLHTTVQDLVGNSMAVLFPESERERVRLFHSRRMEGDESLSRLETGLLTGTGGKVPVEMNAGVITYEGEPADLVLFRDVTARKREEDALRRSERRFRDLSYRDELTGLFNSRFLALRGVEEVRAAEVTGKDLSMVMMDVDDFKDFNDTYGHPAGDEVLRRLGRVVGSELREDDQAFRYGGEEFSLLLPGSDGATALGIAERIRTAFAVERFQPPGGEEGVGRTLSLGVATLRMGEEFASLTARADQALYRAKHRGKNLCCREEEEC
ncbi:sensor domain-containing diguanylate cyclase [Desulfocurvus sp. DL9XJH121]